jgi:integrase
VLYFASSLNSAYLSGTKKLRRSEGSVSNNGSGYKAEYHVCGLKAKVCTFPTRELAEEYRAERVSLRNNIYDMIEARAISPSEAAVKLCSILNGEELRSAVLSPNMRFVDYCYWYIDNFMMLKYNEEEVRASTIVDYNGFIKNHITSSSVLIGSIKLNALSRQNFTDFCKELLEKGLSRKTARNIIKFCEGALKYAVDGEGILSDVPINMKMIKVLLKNGKRQKDSEVYTVAEAQKVVDAAYELSFVEGALIHTCLTTGLRRGEALGLRFSDIDFEDKAFYIKRAVRREKVRDALNNPTYEGAKTFVNYEAKVKTPSSKRRIAINDELINVFRVLESRRKSAGVYPLDAYCFINEDGKVFDPDYVSTIFKKAYTKAGVKKIKVHELRNTYATLRYRRGDSVEDISADLGHTKASTTDRYIVT